MGKFLEKAGGLLGSDKIQRDGAEKREQAGYGDDSGSGGYGGSRNDNY